ncbi:MAG: CPBP family intramembrane metalloprotease, partial [Polyangiaceae bacterium]|nr:CPBP family intramembrane metalloprotease [Polyangiaceae bacterium]
VNFLFSALFLALAAFARDFKDGQNVLMPAYLPMTLLSGVTMLPGVELNRGTAMAPVLNVALLIKSLFQGEAGVELVFWTLASSAVYAVLALLLAARVFTQETVLLGGNTSLKALLGLGERVGERPGPAFALSVFGAALVALFYGSLLLEGKSLLMQHLLSQLGFFLLFPLLMVRMYGFSLPVTYGLVRPKARMMMGALLLGSSSWLVVSAAVMRVLPPPPDLVKGLEKALLFDGAPLWGVLLLGAVVPAVCEEMLFRGLIFGGLQGLGAGWAVVLSSLLFGLAHGSAYRLLPTFSLGLVMGLLRWRSGSLAPSVVFHGLNNGLAVTLMYTRPGWAGALLGAESLPPWVIGGACLLFSVGLWVALAVRARGERCG